MELLRDSLGLLSSVRVRGGTKAFPNLPLICAKGFLAA